MPVIVPVAEIKEAEVATAYEAMREQAEMVAELAERLQVKIGPPATGGDGIPGRRPGDVLRGKGIAATLHAESHRLACAAQQLERVLGELDEVRQT